jgi:uncharacterized alkaline shock family protein YloU
VHGTKRALPGRSRTVLLAGRPRASARVRGGAARVWLTLAVDYPVSVRAAAEAVQARVRECVAAMTGLRVVRVDLDVASLAFPAAAEPRVR